ncbi:sugar phosphate isomerase/epimerase family protein [uncultured Sneathiella sp.]|mgnify:FL=1|uniref:sugar phosphate isomerase/epimerase family protein n=1 Tax=uncultured Sneathiella sp. TaxID=879315 RepID=UPI0030EB212C|tara:strand:- start:19021 stop:19851 length:831 start_codon:yes stop_codon:yes gene_type:complete
MLLSLCNEVLRDYPFPDQCRIAAALGYKGLEVAPFTISDDPFSITDADAAEHRRIAEDHGIEITGLHWLLVAPAGLSLTTDDKELRGKTLALLQHLIELCAGMGGSVLVHGSPKQRLLSQAATPEGARDNASDCFERIASWSRAAGVTYCLEPLSRNQTDFVNTVDEAAVIVDAVNSSAFKTMIDTSSAGLTEEQPVDALVRQWLPTGRVAHIQVNDTNQRAPGQGENKFTPVFQALKDVGYDGIVAVEPFVYEPDGVTTAAVAAGYIHGIMENLT